MTHPDATWPAMIWIGGPPGAGRSTVARSMARAYDLPLHPLDLWTHDHRSRRPPSPSPEEELAAGPQAAADAFVETSRARLELVMADIRSRELGEVPALVEGPQLFPSFADSLPAGYAVWLVPDAEQSRRTRDLELATATDRAGLARSEGLLARDVVLTALMREQAADTGRPVIEVSADPDRHPVVTAVTGALAPAFEEAPRLSPGEALSHQREFENQAACRQARLWAADIGPTELPPFDFACECGQPGCQEIWPGTPDEYGVRRGEGWLLAEEHADARR